MPIFYSIPRSVGIGATPPSTRRYPPPAIPATTRYLSEETSERLICPLFPRVRCFCYGIVTVTLWQPVVSVAIDKLSTYGCIFVVIIAFFCIICLLLYGSNFMRALFHVVQMVVFCSVSIFHFGCFHTKGVPPSSPNNEKGIFFYMFFMFRMLHCTF